MKTAALLAPALAALLLAGCTAAPAELDAPAKAVKIDNCGFALTVDSPPKRIVTVKSTSTELLLALGLGDRIIGTAFPDGPIPASLDAPTIPVISDFQPSEEAVLDLNPDFVFAGWESNLTPDAAGDRADLEALGVGTYVSPSACKEEAYKPKRLTFDNVFSYITEAGAVFGAEDAAAKLVKTQKSQLAKIPTSTEGLTALWWSSGTDTPYVGAGIGAPEMMLRQLGLKNIAADIDDTWSSFNWEAVIDADPDVIVLVDASWNTAESKKAYLASNPATANMSAVKNQRYLVIPFAAGEAGVRNVEATADLAKQLDTLG